MESSGFSWGWEPREGQPPEPRLNWGEGNTGDKGEYQDPRREDPVRKEFSPHTHTYAHTRMHAEAGGPVREKGKSPYPQPESHPWAI